MDSIAVRLENAKLAAAIYNALAVLPADCVVRIELSCGHADVALDVDGVPVAFASDYETMAEMIEDAVRYARGLRN